MQIALLGLVFVVLAAVTDGTYALAAARVSGRVRRRPASRRRLACASAGAYGLLGVVALAG